MADLLAMSEAIIDGKLDAAGVGPINRINHQLSEIADGVAMVEAFSHCVLFATDDGRAWLAVVRGSRWLIEAGYF